MDYGFTLNVDKSFAETEEWAKERLASIGFGILSEIDVQATMKEKLDIDFKPYKILGACNPHLAIEALGVDGNIGLLMPCNVVITEGDNGGSAVLVSNVEKILDITQSAGLQDIAERANTLMKEAFSS